VIDEIVQEELYVNKKAKTVMHELCSLVCSTSLDDTAAAVKQVFKNLNDNLCCYNEVKTESEEDKYDGTTDDEQDAIRHLNIYNRLTSFYCFA